MIEEEGQRVMLGFESRIRCRTLLDGQYRLTIYDGALWGELYDLATDPLELQNQWDSENYALVKASMFPSGDQRGEVFRHCARG